MADQNRPLPEQFARLPEWVQGAMFSLVVDSVLGMGRDEKYETRRQLYELARLNHGTEPLASVLSNMAGLITTAEIAADGIAR